MCGVVAVLRAVGIAFDLTSFGLFWSGKLVSLLFAYLGLLQPRKRNRLGAVTAIDRQLRDRRFLLNHKSGIPEMVLSWFLSPIRALMLRDFLLSAFPVVVLIIPFQYHMGCPQQLQLT